jgi:hypothetical protein
MDRTATPTREKRSQRPCGGCGRLNLAYVTACVACKAPLQRPNRPIAPLLRAPEAQDLQPNPWYLLGLGALLAPTLGLVPVLQYVGWFLASLVHEIGHCIVAWTFGAPAYPAIRIDGHAAAIHGEQKVLLVVLLWLGLAYVTWQVRRRPVLRIVLGICLLLHPLLAWSEGHDVLHLLAGHLAELAFAGLALSRAFSGGFTESIAERITYAAVGWFLLGKNILMNVGLMTSETARTHYEGNGSFGLEQDFLRAAREMGWSLSSVGALMLFLSLAVIPTVWLLRRSARTA